MLKALRNKKTSKKILIGLAAVIIPAFAFWGFSSVLRGPQEGGSVGKIFGKSISVLDFKDAMDATRNLALIQYGDNFSEMEKSLNLQAQAWERLLLLAEAQKRKIRTSDKEVIDFLRAYPFFENKGSFDPKIYDQMLRYVFRTPARIFEEQTRQNLIISKLFGQLTDNLKLTDEEIREEYRKQNEGISVDYIASNPVDFLKNTTFTENELKDFFQKHSLKFKQPLSFKIEYIALAKDDPKNTPKRIKEVFIKLRRSKDFTKQAKELGLELKESGFFAENDPVPGIGWSPQISLLLAKAKTAELLNPLDWEKNYFIVRLKEKKEPFVPDFEAIKDKVKEAFLKEKTLSIARQNLAKCLEELKKGGSFESAAKAAGLKFGSTDMFKYGNYLEGVGPADIFWNAAQKLANNAFSETIETPSGFYIIKVKSRQPVDEKKFSAEKASFTQSLLLQKKQLTFADFLEELKEKAQRF